MMNMIGNPSFPCQTVLLEFSIESIFLWHKNESRGYAIGT